MLLATLYICSCVRCGWWKWSALWCCMPYNIVSSSTMRTMCQVDQYGVVLSGAGRVMLYRVVRCSVQSKGVWTYIGKYCMWSPLTQAFSWTPLVLSFLENSSPIPIPILMFTAFFPAPNHRLRPQKWQTHFFSYTFPQWVLCLYDLANHVPFKNKSMGLMIGTKPNMGNRFS